MGRHLVADAVEDSRSKATLRRLYAHPESGALVTMESRSRLFPKGLATFIDLRDDTCTTPYCDAPIRHHDHAEPAAHGGRTNDINGRGTCEACNYAKEAAGWRATGSVTETCCHTIHLITPTGSNYVAKARRMPGFFRVIHSEAEAELFELIRKAC